MRHICRFWATCPVHCKSGRPPTPQPVKPKKKPKPHNIVAIESIIKPSYNCDLYKTELTLIQTGPYYYKFKGKNGKWHNCVKLVNGRMQVCNKLLGSSARFIEPIKQALNSKAV
jgi:hypothetical protein